MTIYLIIKDENEKGLRKAQMWEKMFVEKGCNINDKKVVSHTLLIFLINNHNNGKGSLQN